MHPFTRHRPKALTPVMGIPVIEYAIKRCQALGFHSLLVNVHHHAQQIRDFVHRLDSEILISDESEQIFLSGGGVRHALHLTDAERLIVLNADILVDFDLMAFLLAHEKNKRDEGAELTLAVKPCSPPGEAYTEIKTQGNQVVGLGERGYGVPFFTGAYVIERSALMELPDEPFDFVPKILSPLIQKAKVSSYSFEGDWFDIGSPYLWWKCHMEWLARLEKGSLPSLWERRVQKVCKKMGPHIWMRRSLSPVHPPTDGGPLFVGIDEVPKDARFGSSLVVYGQKALGQKNGIGDDDYFVECLDADTTG